MEPGLGAVLTAAGATISAHPGLAYLVLFAVALAESLAIVGMAVPGVLIMLIAGTLIADGALAFWPACLLAITGAIVGDSLSFWLGRHHKARLRCLWPFSRHPRPLERGVAFFSRHGAKSVLLGRFIGPMRAVVPLVAGMLEMPTRRFMLANVASALLWGPVYLAPGILFGASLKVASEAATGLLFIGLSLIILLAIAIWVSRRLVFWASTRASAWLQALLQWANRSRRGHPILGRIAAALADPSHPDAATLAGLALTLLVAAVALGLGLGIALMGPENLTVNRMALDLGVILQAPAADPLLIGIAALGDPVLLLWLVAGVFLYLRWRHHRRDANYWLAAAAFALIACPLLGLTVGTARPAPSLQAGMQPDPQAAMATSVTADPGLQWPLPWPWSFPTPPLLGATLVYGFLALLLARALPASRRWIPFALASSLVAGIGFARLYFGTEWLTDLLASFALALVWLATLGLAYTRHTLAARHAGPLVAIILLLWLPGYSLLSLDTESERLLRVRPRPPPQQLTVAQWRAGAPTALPRQRLDLWRRNRQPFDLQYAGPLEDLAQALSVSGWREAETLDWRNALRLLSPSAGLTELPVVPHIHQGQHERLTLSRESRDGERFVLRLWSTAYRVGERGPLWIGDITRVEKEGIVGLLAIPVTRPGTQATELAALRALLEARDDFEVLGPGQAQGDHALRVSRLP